jgi:hypothetical protein
MLLFIDAFEESKKIAFPKNLVYTNEMIILKDAGFTKTVMIKLRN